MAKVNQNPVKSHLARLAFSANLFLEKKNRLFQEFFFNHHLGFGVEGIYRGAMVSPHYSLALVTV